MKLIGLISPNLSEDTLVDVYKVLPEGIRIYAFGDIHGRADLLSELLGLG